MLGLLEISGEGLRVKTKRVKFVKQDLLWVAIPKNKRLYLKKAARILTGVRVIVWDDCDINYLRRFGINPISPGKIYKYFTDKIFMKTLEEIGLSKEAKVEIHTGRVGDAEKRQINTIIKNSRHISVKASNMFEISEWLMENYGISTIENIKTPDITIFMYDDDFSLYYIKNGCKYILNSVNFNRQADYSIGSNYIKSAYVALINSGALNPKGVDIQDIGFRCEKLT